MFNTILVRIKNHRLTIFISILFMLAIVSPRLISLARVGSDFKGIYPTFIEDEVHYESRIQDAVNGHFSIGNPYIKEHQNDTFIQPPIAEWILACLVFLTGLSVPLIVILSNFLILPTFFLLAYFLFYKILKNKLFAVGFTSFFFMLFFQTFGRPISPQLTILFLLPGLLLIFDIFYEKSNRISSSVLNMLLGLNIGICLFISPYYWTSLVVVYGFSMLYKLFEGKNMGSNLKQIFNFSAMFLPFVVLYIVLLFRARSFPAYNEAMLRFGAIYSHWPGSYANIILGFITLFIIGVFWKIMERRDAIFSSIFAVSIFILNWQNVITGQALQFPSHYLVVTILFVLISSAFLVSRLLMPEKSNIPYQKKVFIIVSIMLLACILAYKQKREFTVLIPKVPAKSELLSLQEKSDVFDWLNKNTADNSVVNIFGDDLNPYITVYTHDKVYYDPYAAFYTVSDDELIQRWIISNIFVPKIDTDYLKIHQKDFWWNRYIDSYSFNQNKNKILSLIFRKENQKVEMFPEGIFDPILLKNEAIRKMDKKEVFKKYEMDFIVVSKNYEYYAEAVKAISKLSFIVPMADIDGNKIYKVD